AVLHHQDFQKFEGSWRGLRHLVMTSETGKDLKIKLLNVSKTELHKDVSRATEFDQSQIFKKLYENEFGMPGGEPYGALIGDYEFPNHPQDIELLALMSNVAAASFCPFLSSASPQLFGFGEWHMDEKKKKPEGGWQELANVRDLAGIFGGVEYTQWNSFRAT